jgi:hypothetical protein
MWRAFLFALPMLSGFRAQAYPQYSVRYNVMSCRTCHLSPVGGGPRTVYGKLFGAHGYKTGKWQEQDYVSADLRVLFYYPQKPTESKSGMGIMSGSVAGHAPLDDDGRIQFVIEHNIAGFAAAPLRDTYALFRLNVDDKPNWFRTLLAGRFRAPFGIVTDEHRTYTRVQTATEWYTFETGLLLSGDSPGEFWHYDLALVNGENSGGQSLDQGVAPLWGTVLNVRWMPGAVMVGASGAYHEHSPARDSRSAASLYAILSVARWTDNRWPLTLEFEAAQAWGWGSNLGHGFANDPAYVSAVDRSVSRGGLAVVEWALSQRFVILYKLDYLIPDREFPADYYVRHGLGVRWWIGPNTIIQARTEVARAAPPSEAGSTQPAAQNATYALLQLAF